MSSPQSYDPGVEAQVDWYEAYADLDGERVKLQDRRHPERNIPQWISGFVCLRCAGGCGRFPPGGPMESRSLAGAPDGLNGAEHRNPLNSTLTCFITGP